MLRFSEDGSTFEVTREENRTPAKSRKDGRVASFCVLKNEKSEQTPTIEIPEWKTTQMCRDEGVLVATFFRRLGVVKLPDADISKIHAEVSFGGRGFSIRDLGSLNGTYVNEQRLSAERQPSKVKFIGEGDVLTLGKTSFTVSIFRRFVTTEEEHEDDVNPLERQLHVSVPRMHNASKGADRVSTPEQVLMAELQKHEESAGGRKNRSRVKGGGSGASLDPQAEWEEIRMTAKEQLDELDRPAKSRRLQLRTKTLDVVPEQPEASDDRELTEYDNTFNFYPKTPEAEVEPLKREPLAQIQVIAITQSEDQRAELDASGKEDPESGT